MASRRKGSKVVDDFEYDEEEVTCDCGLRASQTISRTATNPDRKFFGCPNFGVMAKEPCDFFEWYDIRDAVFKSTRMLSEAVVKLTLENQELLASLERLGATPTQSSHFLKINQK
ncbi:unnamed protein product [Linum tenue]|uniref:GRF-type domain-containing protein n=1 Tax=Linum tenue TaxID=586396 RepID=A0AAV0IWA5_9ROSI|nr:unnamed protein product [Linum tenue]